MQTVDLTSNNSNIDSDIEEMQDMKLESNSMNEEQSAITWIGKHKFIIHPKRIPKKTAERISKETSQKTFQKNEARWTSTKDKFIKWRGIDHRDGKHRLYKIIPGCIRDKIRYRNQNGRVMHSFSKIKLIKIAWKIGVNNPEGFNKKTSTLSANQGLIHFIDGWINTSKPSLAGHIWNHLADNNSIITL
jgi:hypothetical protein